MALLSLCAEFYIFYHLFSHGPQQVGEDLVFHRKAMSVTGVTKVRGLPPNTHMSSISWKVRATAGFGMLVGFTWLGHDLPQPLCSSHLPLMDG